MTMTYKFERFSTIKKARQRCSELEREHKGRFCGIYKGHREYVVQITDPFADEDRGSARRALADCK